MKNFKFFMNIGSSIILGLLCLIGGLALTTSTDSDSTSGAITLILLAIILFFVAWYNYRKFEKEKKELENKQELELQEKQEQKKRTNERIENRLIQLDELKEQLSVVQEIKIEEVEEYKILVKDNEKKIVKKGGEEKFFEFLKVATFLDDYRNNLETEVYSITHYLDDWETLKINLTEDEHDTSLEAINERLKDSLAVLDGKEGKSLRTQFDKMFILGKRLKPLVNKENILLKFYKSIAIAMFIFYLEENRTLFFEIHEAFDRLGVFDNSWQKNVLDKLGSIENRLSELNNQMTGLNENFQRLTDKTDIIAKELKQNMKAIGGSLGLANILQGITAYQVYKVNKSAEGIKSK